MRISKMATPGFAVALLLLALSFTGAGGILETAEEVWGHVIHIHPFIAALVGVCAFVALVFQGADLGSDVDNWLVLPLLQFLSHVFSFAFGALFPLAFVAHGPWEAGICSSGFGVLVVASYVSFMAIFSTAALLIVEQRVEHRTAVESAELAKLPAPPKPITATKRQLRLFVILLVASLVFAVFVANDSRPSDRVIASLVKDISGVIGCKVPK